MVLVAGGDPDVEVHTVGFHFLLPDADSEAEGVETTEMCVKSLLVAAVHRLEAAGTSLCCPFWPSIAHLMQLAFRDDPCVSFANVPSMMAR